MQTKTLWVLLFMSILVTSAAPADDLLDLGGGTTLSIRSDTVLSGIDPYRNEIQDVTARLGKPDAVSVLRIVSEGTFTLTWRSYEWEKGECVLRIIATENEGSTHIESLAVRGKHPCGTIGITGRGLKLGDSIRDARRIYGLRDYFGIMIPQEKRTFAAASSCVSDAQAILLVELDDAGKVNHMRLNPSTVKCF